MMSGLSTSQRLRRRVQPNPLICPAVAAPGLFPRHRDLVFSFSPRRFRRLKAVLTGRAAIDHKWTEILGHQI